MDRNLMQDAIYHLHRVACCVLHLRSLRGQQPAGSRQKTERNGGVALLRLSQGAFKKKKIESDVYLADGQ
jgi:hypothetical protein